ncbi:MAG TPA: neutral zinc metallopeptidase [Dermatophilaceae bacterium]|nr:neutral zinc metallopeptidase [Dermatophilaceae bacterium]
MSFNENAQLDTSQVESGGRGGYGGGGGFPGGIQVGGGIGGLILLILALIFGGGVIGGGGTQAPDQSQSSPMDPGQVSPGGQQSGDAFANCKTGADANKNDECLVIGTVNSVQAYYANLLPQYGKQYPPAKTVIYSGSTQSACGTASNQVGPFYCPLDSKVYIDASFFQELTRRFGADQGNLAKMYVVAHEYGHHIQNVLGLLNRAQQDPQGPQSGAVRTELMADCLAGTWVKHASETKDANGVALLKPPTQQDIQSALSAASAVGDDRIQQATQGRVTPENWTHGSAAARQKWFMQGYTTGDINQCNTFAVGRVE